MAHLSTTKGSVACVGHARAAGLAWRALFSALLFACAAWRAECAQAVARVRATVETTPVPVAGDRADDPCVWIHPTSPALSTVIGTNKDPKGGLHVYDLSGKELQFARFGRANNVDIRYDFPLGRRKVSLVTASNRTDDSIAIFSVDPATRKLVDVAARRIKVLAKSYGSCMYRSPKTGRFYFFVNNSRGDVQQWQLFDNGRGKVDGKLVRSFAVGSLAEGCVADDGLAHLYIGEEDRGIWKYGAEPGDGDRRALVDKAGAHFKPDVEGLAIYYAADGTGYLIASSQGNNTYVIYRREGSNDYVATFRIVGSRGVDGVSETDGIDVVSFGLGPAFPKGFFIAQDGGNPGGNQNFKLVPWEAIAAGVNPPLKIDTSRDPRKGSAGLGGGR